jgi:hypothetical protein
MAYTERDDLTTFNPEYIKSTGLTKREYFAAQALTGLLATDMLRDVRLHNQTGGEDKAVGVIATAAVLIADELMGQLNKNQ